MKASEDDDSDADIAEDDGEDERMGTCIDT